MNLEADHKVGPYRQGPVPMQRPRWTLRLARAKRQRRLREDISVRLRASQRCAESVGTAGSLLQDDPKGHLPCDGCASSARHPRIEHKDIATRPQTGER